MFNIHVPSMYHVKGLEYKYKVLRHNGNISLGIFVRKGEIIDDMAGPQGDSGKAPGFGQSRSTVPRIHMMTRTLTDFRGKRGESKSKSKRVISSPDPNSIISQYTTLPPRALSTKNRISGDERVRFPFSSCSFFPSAVLFYSLACA